MLLSRTTVSNSSREYYIDVVSKGGKTLNDTDAFSVQILDDDYQVVADLPFDPMDHTLAAALGKDAIAKLGEDTASVLEVLSKVLVDKIGTKELVLLPPGVELPGFVHVENATFKRIRQVSRADLVAGSSTVLAEYKDLVDELNKQFKFVVGMPEITSNLKSGEPYQEIKDFMQKHAEFTPDKMKEYAQGIKPRFNNGGVTSIALLDSENKLCGVIRSLAMGNEFGYLSDEVVNQEILPCTKFKGSTKEEQEKNRRIFLLAYLADNACKLVKNQEYFLMIAADGREDVYAAVGFKKFPISSNNYVGQMKFGAPGKELLSIKERQITPFSNVEAMSSFGINAAPVVVPQPVVQEQVARLAK